MRTLHVSRTGLQLVSGDDEGFVVLWSLETRRPLAIWQAHSNALLTTRFWQNSSAPDSLIVTHARDNKLRIWRHPFGADASPQAYNTSSLPSDPSNTSQEYPKPWLVYTQDMNALNFCSVAMSNTNIFAAPATISSERIDVYALDSSFGVSRPFKALNASDSLPLDTQIKAEAAGNSREGLLGAVMVLKIDNEVLLAGYESGHVVKFDLTTGKVQFIAETHKAPILSIVTDSNVAYVSAANRDISLLDLSSGQCKIATQLLHRGVASIDVLPLLTRSLLVTAGWDGKVRLISHFHEEGRKDEMLEEEAFPGGRQSGITSATIHKIQHVLTKRRLKRLPPAWIIVAGKDGRIGLHAYDYTTNAPDLIDTNFQSLETGH